MEPTRTPPAARLPRSNADYRWTLPKAKAFLEELAECGKVADAARAVGMSRQSAYRLRDRLADGPLADAFELARRAGIARRSRPRRARSRWEGPGLDALVAPRQGDAGPGKATRREPRRHCPAQSDGRLRQGDENGGQSDSPGHHQPCQHPRDTAGRE